MPPSGPVRARGPWTSAAGSSCPASSTRTCTPCARWASCSRSPWPTAGRSSSASTGWRAFAAEHPELPVVRGYGWFPTHVPTEGMTAEALDRVVPDRPVLSERRQRARAVGQQRGAAPRRDRPGGPGLARRRRRAPPGRLAEGAPARGVPLGGPRVAPVHGGAAEAAFAHFRREIVSRYGITLPARGGGLRERRRPRRLRAPRARRRAGRATPAGRDVRPGPPGGRAGRRGAAGPAPVRRAAAWARLRPSSWWTA